jgi:lipopolysaccharide/colanic/teichoic acid biosynthesis glycosyltransferase
MTDRPLTLVEDSLTDQTVSPRHELIFRPSHPPERLHEWARHYHAAARSPVRNWRMLLRRVMRAWRTTREQAYYVVKRTVEFAFAAALLLVLSPLLLFIAVAIKATDGGPALFWQKRVGLWGAPFDFPKFRSMVVGAEKMVDTLVEHNHHGASITFKIKQDPRVTWIGQFVRRFSLDEVPQLWCVLRGDMSLVGPRPALPREVIHYTQADRRRLGVRPGMTCIWQVSGRADVPFKRQVEMDVEYVESYSLWLDVKLVASTVPAVLTGRGAY